MKAKSCFLAITLLALVAGGSLIASAFERDSLVDLEKLTKKCIGIKKPNECRAALSFAEVLQLQAASRGNYACQSRLLGLEADLILIPLKAVRDQIVLKMLKEVEMFCDGT